jgi:hypothetical protein
LALAEREAIRGHLLDLGFKTVEIHPYRSPADRPPSERAPTRLHER